MSTQPISEPWSQLNPANVLDGTEITCVSQVVGGQLKSVRSTVAAQAALAGATLSVDTIAALRSLHSGPVGGVVNVKGYHNPGGVGGGVFVYVAADTTSADNGGTIIVDSGGRRWYRQFDGLAEPEFFGAFGAGLGGNDTAAIVAALAAENNIQLTSTLGYNISSPPSVGSGQSVTGINNTLVYYSGSACFRMTGFNTESGLFNLTFDGTYSTGPAILMGTGSGVVFRITLQDLRFQNCVRAYDEETHASNYITGISCLQWYCEQTRGLQINSKRSRGFFLWRDAQVDHSFNTVQDPSGGFAFADYDGLELERCDCVVLGRNPAGGRAYIATQAFLFAGNNGSGGNAAVWLSRVFADTCDMDGIVVTNTNYMFLNALEGVNCLGKQASFIGCQRIKMANSLFSGASGTGGAVAAQPGLLIDTCTGFLITTSEALICTGDGITAHSSTGVTLTACELDLNTGYGFNETGSSNKNTLAGTVYSSNTAGTSHLIGGASTDNFPVSV